MKSRSIRQDRDFGAFHGDRTGQLPELTPNTGNMGDHFHQADHGNGAGIHNRAYAGGLHARSRAAEKFRLGMPGAERFHYARSVKIPRSFTSRDENAHLPPVYR